MVYLSALIRGKLKSTMRCAYAPTQTFQHCGVCVYVYMCMCVHEHGCISTAYSCWLKQGHTLWIALLRPSTYALHARAPQVSHVHTIMSLEWQIMELLVLGYCCPHTVWHPYSMLCGWLTYPCPCTRQASVASNVSVDSASLNLACVYVCALGLLRGHL